MSTSTHILCIWFRDFVAITGKQVHNITMLLLQPTLQVQKIRFFQPSFHRFHRQFHLSLCRLQTKDKDLFTELEKQPRRPTTHTQTPVEQVKKESRIRSIIEKLPGPLQKYGVRLVDAPFSHISAFLVLHEVTAIVPFLGLWYLFHEYHFLPADIPSWVLVKSTGVIEKILGDTVADYSIQERTKLILEGATAYGIVKATFPVRVMFSLFCTPWFARVFVSPSLNGLKKLTQVFRKKDAKK